MTPDTKPNTNHACPLSPALVLLLQSCLNSRSTCDKKLAERLFLSHETVHTEFRLIAQCLDTHDRFEAVMIALEKGWITFIPTPPSHLKISLQIANSLFHKITPSRGIVLSAGP